MDLQLAEKQVALWASQYSHALGLHHSAIEAKYIWNPGGFVNQSFRLTDGKTTRHVKFAHIERKTRLKQWASISGHLTGRYHSPKLVHEVTQEVLPGYCYGLVFEFIEGKPLSGISDPIPVIQKAMLALNQLYTDRKLQQAIADAKVQSYSDAFAAEYITRFEEDLEVIRSEKRLLPFVSDSSLEWFYDEVDRLRELASNKPIFQKQATDIVHNDINWENILAADDHTFWIIDWDNLSASGDAAMDYSVLLWPLYQSKEWPIWKEQIIGLAGEELYERMELYMRAKLLDDVIDVLADYIEAENIPAVKEMTQKRAREIHLRAYPEYMKLYAKQC